MKRGPAVIAAVLLSGCASRGAVGKGTRLEPAIDLYSRNWIVGGPTLVGNVIGGVVGLPFYAALAPFAECDVQRPEPKCNWAGAHAEYTFGVPALALGALFGAPFIPFSFLAPE